MRGLRERLSTLPAARLQGMRRGVEKESLRTTSDGQLARTPHPTALGSALTHPHITTDFSESQIELVTGVHPDGQRCAAELRHIHQMVYRALGDELLWASSMPCTLPTDDLIPLGDYGSSNVGRIKTVYRAGLGHRYGRRMQTISGIHYNWSLPGLSDADYFGLIRNFRRHSFVLLLLFGASPAVCASFVQGLTHTLEPLGADTLHMPYATSLRMGRLGYQSEAQNALRVSYNSLECYAASLADALVRPFPAYEKLGIQAPDGSYRQLATSLLQIENEFYGTIRPKRIIHSGERPLHALRERGVEYIEVRCMDLDPYTSTGISTQTFYMLDTFLLHCLLSDSPPDSAEEICALGRNQQRVAAHGREPGLQLERDGDELTLVAWAAEILQECAVVADHLDTQIGGNLHTRAIAAATAALETPQTLPSACVLAEMTRHFKGSHAEFTRARSKQARAQLLQWPLDADAEARLRSLASRSIAEQSELEQSDRIEFETYRKMYLAPERLQLP